MLRVTERICARAAREIPTWPEFVGPRRVAPCARESSAKREEDRRRSERVRERKTRPAGLLGPEFTTETAITSIARHGYIAAPKTVSCLSRFPVSLPLLTLRARSAISGMRFSFAARTRKYWTKAVDTMIDNRSHWRSITLKRHRGSY